MSKLPSLKSFESAISLITSARESFVAAMQLLHKETGLGELSEATMQAQSCALEHIDEELTQVKAGAYEAWKAETGN